MFKLPGAYPDSYYVRDINSILSSDEEETDMIQQIKLNKIRRSIILLVFLIMLSALAVLARVSVNNEKYLIDCELESQGYSPIDGKYYIDDCRMMSKDEDISVDICFISPQELGAGTKLYRWVETENIVKSTNQFYCNSSKYGWISQGELAYCNQTVYDDVTNTLVNKTDLVYVGDEYKLTTNPNYAIVNWNTTTTTKSMKMTDVTSALDSYNINTEYGDYQYCGRENFKQGQMHYYRFVLKLLDYAQLPLKWSLAFGDIASRTIHYILDPTITNARTWTTSTDFTNGTTLSNVTTESNNNDIRLDSEFKTDIQGYWTFDTVDNVTTHYIDISGNGRNATKRNGATSTISGNYNQAVALVDASGQYLDAPYALNGSLSIFGWYYFNTINVGDGFVHKDNYFNNADQRDFWFCIDPVDGTEPRMYIWTTSGTLDSVNANVSLATGVWVNIGFTYDAATGRMEIYKNGFGIGQDTHSDAGKGVRSTHSNLYFGKSQDNAEPTRDFDGFMDEIIILNRSVTDAEAYTIFRLTNKTKQYPFYYTDGEYKDVQGWNSSAANKNIKNISIEYTSTSVSTASFCYDTTNTTLASCTALTNGTNTINLTMTATDSLYYKINYSTTSANRETPKITSYTLYEATENQDTSVTYNTQENITVNMSNSGNFTFNYNGNKNFTYNQNENWINITEDSSSVLYNVSSGANWGLYQDPATCVMPNSIYTTFNNTPTYCNGTYYLTVFTSTLKTTLPNSTKLTINSSANITFTYGGYKQFTLNNTLKLTSLVAPYNDIRYTNTTMIAGNVNNYTLTPKSTDQIEVGNFTYCGDSIIQALNDEGIEEECEGIAIGTGKCADHHYTHGIPTCTATCALNYSVCWNDVGGGSAVNIVASYLANQNFTEEIEYVYLNATTQPVETFDAPKDIAYPFKCLAAGSICVDYQKFMAVFIISVGLLFLKSLGVKKPE